MKIKQVVPTLITREVVATRDFYANWFGFEAVFDSDWYVHLKHPDSAQEIGVLTPNHESQPEMFQPEFNGHGVGLSIEVDDVDAVFHEFTSRAAPMWSSLRDEPWGGRQFLMRDPAGMAISVYQIVRNPQAASIEAGLLTAPV